MENVDTGHLLYLVLLGAVILSWYLVEMRANLGRTLKQAMAWGLIFLGVIAAVGLWQDIQRSILPLQASVSEDGHITVPRARDGHYYLTLQVNDTPVRFVVDTGASEMVLTRTDAQRVGLNLSELAFVGRANTANGTIQTAPVWLQSVAVDSILDRDVRAFVNDSEMEQSLLGMGYLQRFSRLEITGGTMVLTR